MNDPEKTLRHDESTIIETSPGVSAKNFKLDPYLIIVSGQEQGKHYRLHPNKNTFGRSYDVDIMLDDSKVSRKHGAFVIYPDHIVLEDYQSTNGCFVNGERIKRQIIQTKARIQIGNLLMKIEYKKVSEVESDKAIYLAANRDELTQLLNRRAFMTRAQEEFSFCQRSNGNLAIIMCDIDYFKRINDNFGHLAGDQVLRDLAIILQMRKEDIVARFGGEEFIILLRNANAASAVKWAERVRLAVKQFNFTFQEEILPTTLSMGICYQSGKEMVSLDAAIMQADNALYQAKNNGRNRVELA